MKKLFIFTLVLVSIFGCVTTESKNQETRRSQNTLYSYEYEYSRAVDCYEAKQLAGNARNTSKIINDMRRFYGYHGQVYDRPVTNEGYLDLVERKGLKDIGFPMSGSTQSQIMWDCINKFATETGMRYGQWFEISIKIYRNENEFYNMQSVEIFLYPDIYFIGRYEGIGVRGIIFRRP